MSAPQEERALGHIATAMKLCMVYCSPVVILFCDCLKNKAI